LSKDEKTNINTEEGRGSRWEHCWSQ